MNERVHRYLDRYYPDPRDDRRDFNGVFYDAILRYIDAPHAEVLNVGAGPTPESGRSLKGRVKLLVGVDPDPVVLTNTELDQAYVNDGIHLPFDDSSFDAVIADWTLEHVEQPIPFLQEIRRVLRPGAPFWFRTTNRLHYVTLVSAHTPFWFHRLVANRVRGAPKDQHAPWPTRYRLNTRASVRRRLAEVGFRIQQIRMLESYPVYLVFNSMLFRLGIVYERLVNRYVWLSDFRLFMIVRAIRN